MESVGRVSIVELGVVADAAIKHTSIGGNNCPENNALWHVTRITTRYTVNKESETALFVTRILDNAARELNV